MTKTVINSVIAGCVLFAFLATFVGGCQYGKTHKRCPQITQDTLLVHDTITYHIKDTIPYYIAIRDTIYQTGYITVPVDTAEILKDYFSTHVYDRSWADSLIEVSIKDKISRNTPIDNEFSYKILRPQTVVNNSIDNSITYNRYVSVGVDVGITGPGYLSLVGSYTFDKGYAGLGYEPIDNVVSVKIGFNIIKFKHKK